MPDMEENEFRQMSFLDRLFVNKKAFSISIFAAIICYLYLICSSLFQSETLNIFGLVSLGVIIVSLIFMGYCSRTYRDNAVKNIIGIILGITFAYDLRFFDTYYSYFPTTGIVIGAVKIALGLVLIVFYIFARDSKKSDYKLITYVHIAFFTFTVFVFLNNMPYFALVRGMPFFWSLQSAAETLSFICTYFSIVCAASTVDRYKMIRDYYTKLGKWTEELRKETKKELFGK